MTAVHYGFFLMDADTTSSRKLVFIQKRVCHKPCSNPHFSPANTIWKHLLFEGTFFLLGCSGYYFALQKSKVPFYIVRFLGEIHKTLTKTSLFCHGKMRKRLRNAMGWKTEGETGSSMTFTLHLNTTAMKVHDALGNRKAKTKSG